MIELIFYSFTSDVGAMPNFVETPTRCLDDDSYSLDFEKLLEPSVSPPPFYDECYDEWMKDLNNNNVPCEEVTEERPASPGLIRLKPKIHIRKISQHNRHVTIPKTQSLLPKFSKKFTDSLPEHKVSSNN